MPSAPVYWGLWVTVTSGSQSLCLNSELAVCLANSSQKEKARGEKSFHFVDAVLQLRSVCLFFLYKHTYTSVSIILLPQNKASWHFTVVKRHSSMVHLETIQTIHFSKVRVKYSTDSVSVPHVNLTLFILFSFLFLLNLFYIIALALFFIIYSFIHSLFIHNAEWIMNNF